MQKNTESDLSSKRVVRGEIKEQTVVDILRRDHRDIEELFSRGEKAQTATERTKLFQAIADFLELHSQGEEMILYPRLEAAEEMRDLAQLSYNDHEDIRRAVGELESVPSDDVKWMNKYRSLRDIVRKHVRDEENKIFPLMRRLFPENLLIEMGVAIRQSKESLRDAS